MNLLASRESRLERGRLSAPPEFLEKSLDPGPVRELFDSVCNPES
jgi:hypothetical protein